jgi:hypothetical protein
MAQKSTNAARAIITRSMAREAVLSVMAKRGGKPIDAAAWLRSLTSARRTELWERCLGHFGSQSRAQQKNVLLAKRAAAKRRTGVTKRGR